MNRQLNTSMLNDPFFIGFDRVLDRMQAQTPGQSNNYPPYNIIKLNDEEFVIEIALAGFNEDEIEIEVKDGVLTVQGSKEEAVKTEYLHKGISARQFKRTFTLSDTIVVGGADYVNGILYIELENVIPEEKKPRKIAIGGKQQVLNG